MRIARQALGPLRGMGTVEPVARIGCRRSGRTFVSMVAVGRVSNPEGCTSGTGKNLVLGRVGDSLCGESRHCELYFISLGCSEPACCVARRSPALSRGDRGLLAFHGSGGPSSRRAVTLSMRRRNYAVQRQTPMAVIAATKDRTEYGRVLKWCKDHGLHEMLSSTDEAEILVLQLRLSGRDTRLVQFAVEVANLDRWTVWVRD